MNRFKKTAAWFYVIGMALAMSIGYTAGPEKNSGFNDNDKSEKNAKDQVIDLTGQARAPNLSVKELCWW